MPPALITSFFENQIFSGDTTDITTRFIMLLLNYHPSKRVIVTYSLLLWYIVVVVVVHSICFHIQQRTITQCDVLASDVDNIAHYWYILLSRSKWLGFSLIGYLASISGPLAVLFSVIKCDVLTINIPFLTHAYDVTTHDKNQPYCAGH